MRIEHPKDRHALAEVTEIDVGAIVTWPNFRQWENMVMQRIWNGNPGNKDILFARLDSANQAGDTYSVTETMLKQSPSSKYLVRVWPQATLVLSPEDVD